MSNKIIKYAILFFSVIQLTGCGASTMEKFGGLSQEESNDDTKYSSEVFAMDTYMTVTAYGKNGEVAVEKAEKEIDRLDKLLSTGDSGSEIYAVNKNEGGQISEDTKYLFERSSELYESTDGRFNIAIYPLMKEWGFTDQNFKVPDEKKIKELLEKIDFTKIDCDKNGSKLKLSEGMAIDFGGIAKGYTSGRIMDIYRECGITSGLVSLGGNVQLYGTKPDGSSWKVGIQDPDNTEEFIGVFTGSDVAVITSGGYERYFEEDGKTYHHIINPETGYPADSGLKSVTIISEDGTLADGLSTSLYIMGENEAVKYWKQHSSEFDMILMKNDGSLVISENIADDFETELDINVINEDK